MISRTEKARLGIFLIVAISALVVTVTALAGFQLMKESDLYVVYYDESVSGLEVGAQVKYQGVRVGQISDIRIDPDNTQRVIVDLELRKGTPIKTDTKAVMISMGITGLKFVELTGGSSRAKLLEPGGKIEPGQSLFGSLEGKAEDIAVKTELALTRINRLLDDKNLNAMSQVLANMSQITGDLAQMTAANRDHVNALVADAAQVTANVRSVTGSFKRTSKNIEGFLGDSRDRVNSILENADATIARFGEAAKSVSKVDTVLEQIERTLKQVNRDLKATNVGAIAQGVRATVDETQATLRSIRRIVAASQDNLFRSSESLKNMIRNFEELSNVVRDQPSLLISSDPPADRTPAED